MGNSFLSNLRKDRLDWVEATKKNKFEAGINNLLTELYPNNAHFIYELLQNAEDAGATKVKFELHHDKIIFKHNGSKLFDNNDIDGITSIGEGTKKDAINQIGKFGVGFKAVFSYTDTPQIFSGSNNFEIRNLVVPIEIEPIQKNENETIFYFPFNNKNKPLDIAFTEVEVGLKNLSRITLLFLSNIVEIDIKLLSDSYTIRKIEDVNTHFVKILDTSRNKEFTFLKFIKYLPHSDKLYVSIAFKITTDKKSNKERIEMIKNGKVSIFFPAEKETSNLKFHLHAPFASTVARDSIKNRQENNQLIELIAELLCDASKWIKKNGLLDYNFLKCLPIDDDNLSEFYKPIQNNIIELFKTKDFLLCDDEKFHPANMCFRASKKLKDTIDIKSLMIFKDIDESNRVYWAKNPPQRNSREDKFIQSLSIESIEEEDIFESIKETIDDFFDSEFILLDELEYKIEENSIYDEKLTKKIKKLINKWKDDLEVLAVKVEDIIVNSKKYDENYIYELEEVLTGYQAYTKHKLKRFLYNRSSDWLRGLYEYLQYVIEKEGNNYDWYYQHEIRNFKVLIKLTNGSYNFDLKDCYFSSNSTKIDSLKEYFIDSKTYETEKDVKKNYARIFLENLGVKEITLEQEIKHILKEDYQNAEITYDDHIGHIKLFLKYYQQESKYNSMDIFSNFPCLINSENNLVKPDKILIDSPWQETGLKILANKAVGHLLNDLYYEKLTKKEKKLFPSFLSEINCHFSIPIDKQSIWSHPKSNILRDSLSRESEYRISIDYDLPLELKKRLDKKEYNFSLFVWESMCKITNTDIFKAQYRPNASSKINSDDSSLIYTLRDTKWIPDKNGVFHKPNKITEDELDDNFIFDNANDWLTKIHLGEHKKFSKKKYKQADEILEQNFGFRLSTLEQIKAEGITEKKLLELVKREREDKKNDHPNLKDGIQKHNRNIQKQSESINPDIIHDEENYRERVQEKLDKNLEKSKRQTHKHISSHKVKIGKSETKEFLSKQYQGFCQICGFTFDQNNNKGKYFEVFDWLSKGVTNQSNNIIDAGSSLCLCSRCHSILKFGDFEVKMFNEIEDVESLEYDEFTNHFNLSINNDEIPEVFSFIEFDMYKIPIRMLQEDANIYYSEEHFLHFYTMLNLKESEEFEGTSENSVKLSNSPVEDNDEQIIQKTIRSVKSNDIVQVKYLDSGKELKIKLVNYPASFSNVDGISEISAFSPFGKKVIGESVGTVFNLGKYKIKILDIE